MTAASATAEARPRGGPLALLRAMRPYQWPKNVLVFAALAFSAGEAWEIDDPSSWWPLLWRTCLIFVCWCAAASSTYLINDLQDREADRIHPRKRLRPIASGAVSSQAAVATATVLAIAGVVGATLIDEMAGAILLGYIIVMLGYSFGLKRVAILDVIILCSGVIGRAVGGAVAIDVHISPWLYVCSSCAAFFFASSKRWSEFRQLGPEAAAHRPSLAHYTGPLLDQMVNIGAATALLSYALYTIEAATVPVDGQMALTIPFVAFALFRYLMLLNGERKNDAPDQILFTDPQILLAGAGWLIVAMAVLIGDRS